MCTPRISSGAARRNGLAGSAFAAGCRKTEVAPAVTPETSRTRPKSAATARIVSTPSAVRRRRRTRRLRSSRRWRRSSEYALSDAIATRVWDGIRRIAAVVLSDATIARYLAEGKVEIDPYDESLLQPSSVDVRVDRLFRVFRNNRAPYIDVKIEQDLTELVEVEEDEAFILHPGEFVLGSTLERIALPD